MKISTACRLAALSLAAVFSNYAATQTTPPATKTPAAAGAAAPVKLDVLQGRWVRPDGGYVITIKGVAADGKLDAMYANPATLPFASAQATRQGATLRAFFELRAGGYGGSTYELVYEPMTDRLAGTYYQAVAKQKYEVYFTRQ